MEARLEDDEAAFVLRRLDGDRAPEWPSPSPPEASSNRIDMNHSLNSLKGGYIGDYIWD